MKAGYKNESEEMPDYIGVPESEYLYLKMSGIPKAGKGLFTSILICKNEVIANFKGEILSNMEASKRAKLKLDGYFINMLNGDILDSRRMRCFAKYANDADGISAAKVKNNSIISLDENEQVCLVATRNIKIGEEIFCSYGKRYWSNFRKSNSLS